MAITINYGKVVGADRDVIAAGLRAAGKHELADKVPAAELRVMSDIAWLLSQSASAFRDGRVADGLTLAERALEPKWESARESADAYASADWESQPLAAGVA